ncbi:unnamed protein product [Orchesella dallaii]|uniref:Phosphotransferase n=1 Tax=Orchesella dallaii TaxID=48710 RepID=A0ABP1Q7J2_9HEXA
MELVANNTIKEICEALVISDSKLAQVRDLLHQEIEKGLCKETNPEATVKCFPSYVRHLPNRKEAGKFLALDLGGTNFRILLIELTEEAIETKIVSKIFAIPNDIMVGPGSELFDYIAHCLSEFVHEYNVQHEKLPLGFTFSFPLRQEGLSKGVLVKWAKGFTCSGVVGEDIVRLLQEAVERKGDFEVDIVAILNDTTGTLMSCSYENPQCRIAIIVGTGTNACYVEDLDKVEMWDGDCREPRQVLINTEWGAFGEDGSLDFILTEYDRELDQNSLDVGHHIFGKMISGMYIGEIAGLVLRRLCREGLLFNGKGSEKFYERGSFDTKYLSEIEEEESGVISNCQKILDELCIPEYTEEDCSNVRYVCELVSRRSAALVSAGVACLLNRVKEKHVVVAMDGSVYRLHPAFHTVMVEGIAKLIDPDLEFELVFSKDGGGKGAALVAAVTARISDENDIDEHVSA